MRINFFKLSTFVALVAVLTIAVVAGTVAQASNPAQSTSAATMAATQAGTPADSGAIKECPDVIPQPTAEATGAATDAAMAATPAATMAPATMAATAAAATPNPMQLGAFKTTVGCSLEVTLAGENEAPKPADKSGHGDATLIVSRGDTGTGEICFLINISGIKLPATASHIHVGVEGVAGPVVVTLAPPNLAGRSSGCITGVDRALVEDLVTKPYNYYVNVHTTDFPGGAARGQLHSPNQN